MDSHLIKGGKFRWAIAISDYKSGLWCLCGGIHFTDCHFS